MFSFLKALDLHKSLSAAGALNKEINQCVIKGDNSSLIKDIN